MVASGAKTARLYDSVNLISNIGLMMVTRNPLDGH